MAQNSARAAAFYRWQNADGSPGGDVSAKAHIHPTATIGQYATVLAGAEIGPNQVVPVGHIVDSDGTMISFGQDIVPPVARP